MTTAPVRYIHIKSGAVYYMVGTALNATNAQDGDRMVIYHKPDQPEQLFVREATEFHLKFQRLQ